MPCIRPLSLLFDVRIKFLSLVCAHSINKAGFTATSCGRVGRGGNARFPTFQLERDGPTNQPTNGPTDGQSLL